MGVEYQNNASDFFVTFALGRRGALPWDPRFSIFDRARRAVEAGTGTEPGEPVVAGEQAPDCMPVYGHHDSERPPVSVLTAGRTGWKYL